jgi:hypothetical protein
VPPGLIGQVDSTTEQAPAEQAPAHRRITSIEVLCAVLVVAILAQSWLQDVLDVPAGSTVFVAVCVQALPSLVLGVPGRRIVVVGPFGDHRWSGPRVDRGTDLDVCPPVRAARCP